MSRGTGEQPPKAAALILAEDRFGGIGDLVFLFEGEEGLLGFDFLVIFEDFGDGIMAHDLGDLEEAELLA